MDFKEDLSKGRNTSYSGMEKLNSLKITILLPNKSINPVPIKIPFFNEMWQAAPKSHMDK